MLYSKRYKMGIARTKCATLVRHPLVYHTFKRKGSKKEVTFVIKGTYKRHWKRKRELAIMRTMKNKEIMQEAKGECYESGSKD